MDRVKTLHGFQLHDNGAFDEQIQFERASDALAL
jgi:hypothetical protein